MADDGFHYLDCCLLDTKADSIIIKQCTDEKKWRHLPQQVRAAPGEQVKAATKEEQVPLHQQE